MFLDADGAVLAAAGERRKLTWPGTAGVTPPVAQGADRFLFQREVRMPPLSLTETVAFSAADAAAEPELIGPGAVVLRSARTGNDPARDAAEQHGHHAGRALLVLGAGARGNAGSRYRCIACHGGGAASRQEIGARTQPGGGEMRELEDSVNAMADWVEGGQRVSRTFAESASHRRALAHAERARAA
ncbi:MAG: hypothetical protein IPO20_14150 [Gammaproteobacteria bacterium]|nr:hypothetical protein [Gammaproteobacteria bacterium]